MEKILKNGKLLSNLWLNLTEKQRAIETNFIFAN